MPRKRNRRRRSVANDQLNCRPAAAAGTTTPEVKTTPAPSPVAGGAGTTDLGNDLGTKLFNDETAKDITISVRNEGQAPQEFRCHSLVLSVQSPIFRKMLNPTARIIKLKDVSGATVETFLRYLYLTQIPNEVSCPKAVELMKVAHLFEVPKLLEQVTKLLLGRGANGFSPNGLLELYGFVKHEPEFKKLKLHSLQIMKRMLKKLKRCERYRDLSKEEREELHDDLGAMTM